MSTGRAPRVAFYTYPEWAFGSIHSALCKELYKRGIFANIIDWNHNFTPEERRDLGEIYDIFVTVPGNSVTMLNESFHIPPERIIAVAHGRYDIEYGLSQNNQFDRFKKFAGVSPDLAQHSKFLGINRSMNIVRNGIHFDYFCQTPSQKLSTLGYGGAFKHHDYGQTQDIKRGYLAQEIADKLALNFAPAPAQTYLTMPQYYNSVDAVIVTSTQESCALPLMECAASGRLPISTPVGVARDFPSFPGILLPLNERKLVKAAIDSLCQLRFNDEQFQNKCKEAQEYARYNYDWSIVIDDWVALFSS